MKDKQKPPLQMKWGFFHSVPLWGKAFGRKSSKKNGGDTFRYPPNHHRQY